MADDLQQAVSSMSRQIVSEQRCAVTRHTTYDEFGRVLTADGPRTDVSDVTTTTCYDCTRGSECGQVKTITDALGQVTTLVQDGRTAAVCIESWLGVT